MTMLDAGARRDAAPGERGEARRPAWRRVLRRMGPPPGFARWLRRRLPRRLFPRSLLIIILPMLILQSVVAAVFMDRHWEGMTERLSQATASELAMVVELLEALPDRASREEVLRIADRQFFDQIQLLDTASLPRPAPKPFFSLLDRTLSRNISLKVGKPFWIDTVGRSAFVEIRVKLDDAVLQVVTRRSQTYASNSHITLVWMAGTSLVLIAVAVLFLRNQVRPVQKLAKAAERFGRGQPVEDFRPYGALEVRQAAWAFIDMRRRIERQMEQRTAMLAGVSHDLRTMLTRFRLELALISGTADTGALEKDVAAMQAMLEDYLAFARTEVDEHADAVDIGAIARDVAAEAARGGAAVAVAAEGKLAAPVKPNAFRRMLANLVGNAVNHAGTVEVAVLREADRLVVTVDDDGPGIPPEEREEVFKPFYRLDRARNQDTSGTGLGLTIARDIARKHGGDVRLTSSPAGGLRAEVSIPL